LLAALLVLVFLAYSNSFGAPFLLDNEEIILHDARVHTVSSVQLHRILTQQYWETATTGLYRPLTTLSYLFNYAVLGNANNPEGYHWLNLLLHLANIAMVYILGLAIFENVSIALLVSAIWGLHPIHTEAVTNIVGRADLLVAFGTLAALLAHRQAAASTGARRAAWFGAVLLAAAIAAFSKESGVVVIAVLVLYDVVFAHGTPWSTRLTGYAAAALPCALYFYARAQVLANAPYLPTAYVDNPMLGTDFWTARWTAVKILGKYFQLLVWPAQLSYDYSYNEIPLFAWFSAGWEDTKAVVALLGCIAVAAAAVWAWRRNRPVFFGIAFFAVTFAPASNLPIVIGSMLGERLMYLPAVGFAICAAAALWALWRRVPANQPTYRYTAWAVLGILLTASLARTYDRNGDWLDAHRFWRTGAEASPNSVRTNMNVVTNTAGLTQEDWDRGIQAAGRALAILDKLPDDKSHGQPFRDAGMFYREVGERLASKQPAGVASAGTTPEYWYRLSLNALLRSEKIELAFDEAYRAENARRGRPGLTAMPSKVYLELGRTYMRLNDPGRALAAFERGRVLESSPVMLEELAEAYRQSGDLHAAIIALEESYTVDSNRPVLGKLVDLYGKIDPNGCSVAHQGGGSALNPDCPGVHADICLASRNIMGTYVRRGQTFEAEAVRKRAVEYLGCAPELLR
jgi:tetratricopeptide (TPR) repeat protein